MDSLMDKMVGGGDDSMRKFRGGLSKEEIVDSLRGSYLEIAERLDLDEEASKFFVAFMVEKLGDREVDPAYLREWAVRFGAGTVWEEASAGDKKILAKVGYKTDEGIVPDDKDSEEKKIKKLTEEDEEDEKEKDEEDTGDEATSEPDKEEDETGEEGLPGIDKEYVGSKGDVFFYLVRDVNAEDLVEDLKIINQDEVTVFSAVDANIEDKNDLLAFVIAAIQEIDIDEISYDLFTKYILPELVKEEEEEGEEEGGEEGPPEEKPGGMEDVLKGREFEEAPIETKVSFKDKEYVVELVASSIRIGDTDYKFSPSFLKLYEDKGKITEKRLQRLAIDVLKFADGKNDAAKAK